ncbi:fimbria/pilus outer membrane usher protein [Sphingopyxis sp. C-1]|uniref:fimbria/pilus outer membrane usher protein n=1 Tax=Sphingopyxis sp. C-1 TaxID=262667 RepID=UPI00128E4ACA|nr:fimbria/pilus outer membrane usher protein [Sphingopyxis sp. C-1]
MSEFSAKAYFLAGAAACAAVAAPPAKAQYAQPQASDPPAQAQRTIDVNLPLTLRDVYIGDIAARTTTGGEVIGVDAKRFRDLIGPRVNDSARAELEARIAAANPLISLAALQVPGIEVAFDSANLSLSVSISPEIARAQELALSPNIIDSPNKNTVLPAAFAGGMNFFVSKAFVHQDKLNPTREGAKPTTVGIDGFLNVGGIDGAYLFHQWTYNGGRDARLTRGNITLIHDDWRNAIRYAAGDVDPFALPLQGATPLGGVAITRAFAELQPTRNVRPAGRTSFTLDRDAIVEVEVNGVITRTIQLSAGTYNLRDLPFTEGLNEVRLLIQDEAGRREIASFSRSFTTTLLEEGINEFSFAVGFPRFPTGKGFRYGDNPQFSGFFRQGVTQSVTLGINAQADRHTQVAGGEALLATTLGTFRMEASASTSRAGEGFAAAFGWIKSFSLLDQLGEVEAIWDHRSRDFSVLNDGSVGQDIKNDVAFRYRQALPGRVFANAAFGYTDRRVGRDRTRWSGGLSRSFGKLNVSVLYEGEDEQFRGVDHRVFFNLSFRFGSRDGINARYETGSDRYRVEYERSLTNSVGSLGFRAGLSGADGERGFQGEVDYITNRAELGGRFDLFDDTVSGGRVRQTTLRAATAIGFADGAVAVGRPYRDGFAIVERHKTLAESSVKVAVGGAGEVYARVDALGPALVTTNRPYQRNLVTVDVENLPTGYDLGAGVFEVFPGSGSGFRLTVGSDAASTVMGVLVDTEGQPVSLIVGTLKSIDRPGDPPIPLFTNRAGRFAATGLKPGRYKLAIGSDEDTGLEIVIPNDSAGLVNVGKVQMSGANK